MNSTGSTSSSGGTSSTEHLILSVVVKDAEWRADPPAVLAEAHQRLHQRAQQRGLRIDGEPREDVEVVTDAQRVRITLAAEALPAEDEAFRHW